MLAPAAPYEAAPATNSETERPSRREALAVAAVLAVLFAAIVYQAWCVGVTVDEPSHVVSAYQYWRGADNLPPRDMPPLIKAVGGWVPRLFPLPLAPDLGRPGETRHEWLVSSQMMERLSGAQIQRLFFWSRLALAVFPLLTVWLVWRWARQLFRPWAAVALAAMCAAEPTALAHAALFKNDLASTFGYLLFWYSAWRFWRAPSAGRAALLGGATLVAAMSKLSMTFLLVLAPLVVILRCAARPRFPRRTAAAALAPAVLIPYLGALAAYQFDTRRISAFELAAHAQNPRLPAWFVAGAHVFRVIPVARPMWEGTVSLFECNDQPVPVYLLGKVYPQGTPLYFPVALAVKVPAPVQMLLCAGLALFIAGLWRRRWTASDAFWVLPGFLYIGLASLSALQLGVRLVLPALPFGLLLCGVAVDRCRTGWLRVLPAVLLLWLTVRTASLYPHGIAYMNLWTGGPQNGLRYLADSNLDWGQSLPDLAQYVHSRGIRKLHLSYFGNDNVFRYFREDEIELIAPPWSEDLASEARLAPHSGWYAISATLLPGQFFEPKFRDYYRAFRRVKPVARAGNSIYIYKLGS